MESSQPPDTAALSHAYRLSWAAYIGPLTLCAAMLAVAAGLVVVQPLLTAAVAVVALLWLAVRVLVIRSVVLYTDDHGVWLYRGILPWSRGTSGVKWRDLEEASYEPGFISWLLRSHTVRVGHRFTKTSEIVLPHLARGQDAVQHINERHRQALAGGVLAAERLN